MDRTAVVAARRGHGTLTSDRKRGLERGAGRSRIDGAAARHCRDRLLADTPRSRPWIRLTRSRSPRSMGSDRGAARASRGAGCAGQHRLAASLGESRLPERRTPALVSRIRAAACGRTDLLAPSERPVLSRSRPGPWHRCLRQCSGMYPEQHRRGAGPDTPRGLRDRTRRVDRSRYIYFRAWPSYLSSVPRPDSGLTRCRSLIELVRVSPCCPVVVENGTGAAECPRGQDNVCPPPHVASAQLALSRHRLVSQVFDGERHVPNGRRHALECGEPLLRRGCIGEKVRLTQGDSTGRDPTLGEATLKSRVREGRSSRGVPCA